MTNTHRHQSEILQDRYGLRVAARLAQGAESLPHDITERLKASRMLALSKRKVSQRAVAAWVHASGGAAVMGSGDEGLDLWGRIASALPLLVLLFGLVAINMVQNEKFASELAAVDAALLVDDLPPSAYADPGFAQYVQMRQLQASQR